MVRSSNLGGRLVAVSEDVPGRIGRLSIGLWAVRGDGGRYLGIGSLVRLWYVNPGDSFAYSNPTLPVFPEVDTGPAVQFCCGHLDKESGTNVVVQEDRGRPDDQTMRMTLDCKW